MSAYVQETIAAKLLTVDCLIIFPEYGTRAWPIEVVKKVSGARPIEVWTRGKGTWHFKSDEKVTIIRKA